MNAPPITVRNDLRPGDLAFILQSHHDWYFPHHNYPAAFEYIVAKALVESYELTGPDSHTRWWFVDVNKKVSGSLLLLDRGNGLAQLRLFLLREACRGRGLGRQLMEQFTDHLHRYNFTRCYLWTTTEQVTARKLYESNGFRLVEQQKTTNFGVPQTELKYELTLS